MDVTFLTRDDILAIHDAMLLHFGGSPGIRDAGMLDAALAMPSMGSGDIFFHDNLPAMAAAYLYHLVMNHPFVDGNKRVGAMAAYVFLDINGVEVIVEEEAFEAMVCESHAAKMGRTKSLFSFARIPNPDAIDNIEPLSFQAQRFFSTFLQLLHSPVQNFRKFFCAPPQMGHFSGASPSAVKPQKLHTHRSPNAASLPASTASLAWV